LRIGLRKVLKEKTKVFAPPLSRQFNSMENGKWKTENKIQHNRFFYFLLFTFYFLL